MHVFTDPLIIAIFALLLAFLWIGWLFAKRTGTNRESYINLATWIALGILVGGFILVSNIRF